MNSDSYFEIGCAHNVCQDYALHGSYEDMVYGIVSDGCSSAPFSEIGAQGLCHVAKHYLITFYRSGLFINADKVTIANTLRSCIIQRADDIRKLYNVPQKSLQATLLITFAIKNRVFVFAWGDGVIIKRTDFGTEIIQIDYPPSNAPVYPVLDSVGYLAEYPDTRKKIVSCISDGKILSDYDFTGNTLFSPFILIDDNIAYITICTDGLLSYKNKDKDPIAHYKMAAEVTDYASSTGVFVERCMKFLKRKNLKNGITHYDDVACASLIL
jgi:hypothetical protein